MKKEIRLYRTKTGKEPFVRWLSSIRDIVIRAQIKNRIRRMVLGNYGDCKCIGNGIFELRIHCGAGYRVYFAEQNRMIILLLLGGNKNSQKKDIEKAKKYWMDFQEHYNEKKK